MGQVGTVPLTAKARPFDSGERAELKREPQTGSQSSEMGIQPSDFDGSDSRAPLGLQRGNPATDGQLRLRLGASQWARRARRCRGRRAPRLLSFPFRSVPLLGFPSEDAAVGCQGKTDRVRPTEAKNSAGGGWAVVGRMLGEPRGPRTPVPRSCGATPPWSSRCGALPSLQEKDQSETPRPGWRQA
jgi:hypothetical protein